MRTALRHALIPLLGACLLNGTAAADDEPEVYGWVEKTTIEPWGVELKAKLDSGALTSSMQAEHIEEFERDGEEWVRFEIEVEDEATGEVVAKQFEREVYRRLILTGAGGKDRRPAVLLTICMGDTRYQEQFSLENRDDMNYPVLLGRRVIQDLGLLDVTRTFTHSPECDEDSPLMEHADKEYDEDIGI
ncbi:ATP-dependent zinc protease [Halomonas sp. M4R1S46]|uniref:retropepsin-like aspartic peptidase RloA3 n=1 Tax=Halomonas sp. M4R1S46 TaxID=2982692 RepID=UPI0021E3C48B|nr:ATP-dependent zinc protease [Halomonas sp. M4R1S46]UYG08674.1 ATP-dependent zinc protease [Halomonas sp. M4R1S46]